MTTADALYEVRRLVAEGRRYGLLSLVPDGADEAVAALVRQYTAAELEHPELIVDLRRVEIVDAAIEQLEVKENDK